MELQRRRTFCIRQQHHCDRSIESLMARDLGYRVDFDPKERKRLFKQAATIRRRVEAAGGLINRGEETAKAPLAAALAAARETLATTRNAELILASATARKIWDDLRKQCESQMVKLARQLPVVGFVRDVKGLSDLGLAVIVGEAGYIGPRPPDGSDLRGYANPAKLWKRMGLAVLDGKRQGNPGVNASKEDWIRHGYVATRRAEVFAFIDDVLLRHQWRADKDEDGKNPSETGKPVAMPGHPTGPYGEVYFERKQWNLARGWTRKHADEDARRIMSKRVLRDLWRASRDAEETVVPSNILRPAELAEAAE